MSHVNITFEFVAKLKKVYKNSQLLRIIKIITLNRPFSLRGRKIGFKEKKKLKLFFSPQGFNKCTISFYTQICRYAQNFISKKKYAFSQNILRRTKRGQRKFYFISIHVEKYTFFLLQYRFSELIVQLKKI